MIAPTPPVGAVATLGRKLQRDRGEIARWRHTDRLPALELSLRAAGEHGGCPDQPSHVRLSIFPGRLLDGVTDPRELEQCAWLILAAARWLRRQQPATEPKSEPDPQLTIYDHLEASTP